MGFDDVRRNTMKTMKRRSLELMSKDADMQRIVRVAVAIRNSESEFPAKEAHTVVPFAKRMELAQKKAKPKNKHDNLLGGRQILWRSWS